MRGRVVPLFRKKKWARRMDIFTRPRFDHRYRFGRIDPAARAGFIRNEKARHNDGLFFILRLIDGLCLFC